MNQEEKDIQREVILNELSQMSEEVRDGYQKQLFDYLMGVCQEQGYKRIGMYFGFKPELETAKFIPVLNEAGIEVYLPRTLPKRQMAFHRYEGDDKLTVKMGKIMEPTEECLEIDPNELDLLIVPGVGFIKEGYRIGFGGGYYDRFLTKYPLKTMSLIFPQQLQEQVPIEDHDKAVDEIVVASDGGEVEIWK